MSLRIAVVGTGHMGKIHLGKLHAFDGVKIAGIHDIDNAALSLLSEQYRVPSFTDYRKIPNNLDGVVIATPTDTHYSVARSFLAKGVHVFIEKPITFSVVEGRKLIDFAREKGLVFQVGHLERFNPAFRKAMESVRAPVVVEACRVSPFTGRSTDVDVILDLMIHDLDLILSLIRAEVKEIRAQGISLMTDKLDAAGARIEFRNGSVANLFASRIASKRERTLTVFEKERCFFIDFMQGKLTVSMKNQSGELYAEEYISDHMDPVKDELTEFIEAIKGDKEPSVTGEDGLRALILANKIRQYIAKKQR